MIDQGEKGREASPLQNDPDYKNELAAAEREFKNSRPTYMSRSHLRGEDLIATGWTPPCAVAWRGTVMAALLGTGGK